ncbi:hypothetical protein N7466_008970 [Penicillium verhagenii]|uniref:uncharacterized protein n=1 Tax=Penicillium verhagenii TaxID=1562060 RepID=UPI00254533EA|nr:uncharacterized protein N7466_008970 [Penicillium verhagenii]KAJ5924783.1 hypothetical protein N7466_008970 [Penicillium verhagenii]
MTRSRRSGRVKGARTVYTEDPFVAAGISDESGSELTEKGPRSKTKRVKREDSASDSEFDAGSDPDVAEPEEDEDDEGSVDEEENAQDSDTGSRGDGGDLMDVDEIKAMPKKKRVAPSQIPKEKIPTAYGINTPSVEETHTRGILDSRDHVSKFMSYNLTFGSDDRDLGVTIHIRGRWRWGRDSTFPTRVSLETTEGESDSPYGPTLGISPEDLEKERTLGWSWYYDQETGEKFRKQQRMNLKSKVLETRLRYLPSPKPKSHTILMGPANNQKSFHLGYHESMDFSQAWGTKQNGTAKIREGWVVNIGQKIQCMAWAPNQEGASQYLAVAAPITDEQKKSYKAHENPPISSFLPSLPYGGAIQIWEFKGKEGGTQGSTLDMTVEPRLRHIFCSEWGDLRRMAWCPMGREKRGNVDEGLIDIGLLAGVWGDGRVRVLDIKLQQAHKDSIGPKYILAEIISPAFEAMPSSTVCTCVAWLSPSDIAVGCGNGFVAIYSILPCSTSEPEPYFYRSFHATYVLNITSIYPTHPHLLSTISVDGETRLWSMLDPQSETTSTVRVRLASSHLSFSPVLQGVCSSDEHEYGRLMPIRRFFATATISKIFSAVSALAPCSFWHPSLLYGGTGGEVMATNPLRKILHPKETQWQQLWFVHSWVSGSEPDHPGVSRFYEGFSAEGTGSMRNGEPRPMGLSLTTIYEEGTHVTALGWNPNRQCAAWGSAALGCGLLRVEDLAVA